MTRDIDMKRHGILTHGETVDKEIPVEVELITK